jgi:hypothetical protein
MSFNLLQVIGSFFSHLIPRAPGGQPAPAPAPDALQAAINRIGQILDSCEGYVTELQTLIPLLPPAAAGPASIFVNGVHTLDSYVDTLETPAAAPAPATPADPGAKTA